MRKRTLIVGWRGGVGTAMLNLLVGHSLGRDVSAQTEFLLLDSGSGPPGVPLPPEATVLPPRLVSTGAELRRHIVDHRVDRVVDFASTNTIAAAAACAVEGVDYLNTSFDPLRYDLGEPPSGPLLMEGALQLVPGHRPRFDRGSQLVASGMNPGAVSALLERGLSRLAERAGVAREELDLYAIFVTEADSTETDAPLDDDVFPMTWSPESCLDEVLEPRAMMMRGGCLATLDHAPAKACYRVRCGTETTDGFVVPHEEVVPFGVRHPGCEVAYVYRMPPAALRALAAHPERPASRWRVGRLFPPHATRLRGTDRVGVLLCSRRHGELWIGFDTPVEDGLRRGTNATELQVASGALAGWLQLGRVRGLHLVEELDCHAYLEVVEAILGPALEVHDPDAPVRPLRQRRVAAPAGDTHHAPP